jgi:hypothetical protein
MRSSQARLSRSGYHLSPPRTVVTYTVIINAPNPDQKLLPGMTANIVIYAEEINDVLTIPYKAVKFTPEAEYLAQQWKEMASKNGMAGGPGCPAVPACQEAPAFREVPAGCPLA